VFAPADSRTGELSGWYLSYVYDPVRGGSDLVIIDASDFQGKPVSDRFVKTPCCDLLWFAPKTRKPPTRTVISGAVSVSNCALSIRSSSADTAYLALR
jgi:hypothetical protein